MIPSRPALLVAALGLTQIIGYGTLYYAFPVLIPAIAPDFGVSEPLLFGIFSTGYLLGGLAAPTLGGWLDRIGAAQVMTRGSLVIALLLGLLAAAPNILTFGALAILIEIISFTVLYDAAFAVLAQKRPLDTRRAITGLTLIAGFASTIFWPLSAALLEGLGWRGTFGLFAAGHLVCALVHRWLGAQAPVEAAPAAASTPETPAAPRAPDLAPDLAQRAFALLAAGFALSGMAITALTVHLVAILQSLAPGEGAYLAAMMMGPAQVVVRIVDATAWRDRHPLFVALVSAGAIVGAVAVLLLPVAPLALAFGFAAVLGAGAGLSSIVRGAVPVALFGTEGIGARLGRLAGIRTLLSAAAPFLFALIVARGSMPLALGAVLGLSGAGLAALVVLHRVLRRAGAVPPLRLPRAAP